MGICCSAYIIRFTIIRPYLGWIPAGVMVREDGKSAGEVDRNWPEAGISDMIDGRCLASASRT